MVSFVASKPVSESAEDPRLSQLFDGDLEMDICFQTFHADGMRESFLENTCRAGNWYEAGARPEILGLDRGVVHSESLAALITNGGFHGFEQYSA